MMAASDSITKKISISLGLKQAIGLFFEEQNLSSLLPELKLQANRSKELMQAIGLTSVCIRCAEVNQGSGCCSRAIEQWYEIPTLILNLLLGCTLPKRHRDPSTCIFLGETGCTLLVRYHFCVNYLCEHIKNEIPPKDLERLRRQYGRELYISWKLEKEIWKYFNMNSCKEPSLPEAF